MNQITIISGGQTGADRARLDVAFALNIPHGGWCPKGRKALDGALDPKYQLKETPSAAYPQRTELNARDSDGTIIFSMEEQLTGGSLKMKTKFFAERHKKPWIHISLSTVDPASTIRNFLLSYSIQIVNIAGSRESKEPGVYEWTRRILLDVLKDLS